MGQNTHLMDQWLWCLATGPNVTGWNPRHGCYISVEAKCKTTYRQNAIPPTCAMCCVTCKLKELNMVEIIPKPSTAVSFIAQWTVKQAHMQESKDDTDVFQSKFTFTLLSLGKVKNHDIQNLSQWYLKGISDMPGPAYPYSCKWGYHIINHMHWNCKSALCAQWK